MHLQLAVTGQIPDARNVHVKLDAVHPTVVRLLIAIVLVLSKKNVLYVEYAPVIIALN